MSLCFPQRDVYPVYLLVPEGVAWGAGFSEHPLFYRRGDSACMHAKSLQSCLTAFDSVDGALQAPLTIGYSRQEY